MVVLVADDQIDERRVRSLFDVPGLLYWRLAQGEPLDVGPGDVVPDFRRGLWTEW